MSNSFLSLPTCTARHPGSCYLTGKRYEAGTKLIRFGGHFGGWAAFTDDVRRKLQKDVSASLDNTGGDRSNAA